MLNDFAEGAKHMVLKLEYIQHALLNVASARSVRRLQNTTKWRESELEKDVPTSWPDHCYPQAALTWLLSKSSNLQTRTRVLKWRKKKMSTTALKAGMLSTSWSFDPIFCQFTFPTILVTLKVSYCLWKYHLYLKYTFLKMLDRKICWYSNLLHFGLYMKFSWMTHKLFDRFPDVA